MQRIASAGLKLVCPEKPAGTLHDMLRLELQAVEALPQAGGGGSSQAEVAMGAEETTSRVMEAMVMAAGMVMVGMMMGMVGRLAMARMGITAGMVPQRMAAKAWPWYQ